MKAREMTGRFHIGGNKNIIGLAVVLMAMFSVGLALADGGNVSMYKALSPGLQREL